MKITNGVETLAKYNHLVNIMKVTKQVRQNNSKVSETQCDVFKTLNTKTFPLKTFRPHRNVENALPIYREQIHW